MQSVLCFTELSSQGNEVIKLILAMLQKAKTESHSLKVQCGRIEERLKKQEDKYTEDIATLMDDLQEKEKVGPYS